MNDSIIEYIVVFFVILLTFLGRRKKPSTRRPPPPARIQPLEVVIKQGTPIKTKAPPPALAQEEAPPVPKKSTYWRALRQPAKKREAMAMREILSHHPEV